MAGDTGEINRNGNGNGTTKFAVSVLTALTIAAILGGVGAWADGRVTAANLEAHKSFEQQRLDELRNEIAGLRADMKTELRDLRQAVERKK